MAATSAAVRVRKRPSSGISASRSRVAVTISDSVRAHSRRSKGEERKYEKCWYQPLEMKKEIARSYYFTLSLPVTAALPPGEEKLWRMALDLARSFIPVTKVETLALKEQAASLDPLFEYPAWQG